MDDCEYKYSHHDPDDDDDRDDEIAFADPNDLDSSGRKIKTCYDPRFTLDNGARVTFTVDEIDCGDGYGVHPNYHPKQRKQKP